MRGVVSTSHLTRLVSSATVVREALLRRAGQGPDDAWLVMQNSCLCPRKTPLFSQMKTAEAREIFENITFET